MTHIKKSAKTNEELSHIIELLKSGEYGGEDLMACWIALRELQGWRTQHESLDGLRELCGYVEDGSCSTLKIFEDDATKTWHVQVNEKEIAGGSSFYEAVGLAIASRSES